MYDSISNSILYYIIIGVGRSPSPAPPLVPNEPTSWVNGKTKWCLEIVYQYVVCDFVLTTN